MRAMPDEVSKYEDGVCLVPAADITPVEGEGRLAVRQDWRRPKLSRPGQQVQRSNARDRFTSRKPARHRRHLEHQFLAQQLRQRVGVGVLECCGEAIEQHPLFRIVGVRQVRPRPARRR